MDKNNLSVQAFLNTSQLKKDLEKFKGEITLNANTKSIKKQVEAALKEAIVQPSLDTSRLQKELEKFKGEVKLNADTENIAKQLEAVLANTSKNATANIHCNLSGMDSVIGQINNLKQATASLNNDIKLKVSMDTSGLQQYTSQLEKMAKLSSQVQSSSIKATTAQTKASLPTASVSPFVKSVAPGTSMKNANAESKGFLETLNQIISVANTPLSLLGPGGMTERYQAWGTSLKENLD